MAGNAAAECNAAVVVAVEGSIAVAKEAEDDEEGHGAHADERVRWQCYREMELEWKQRDGRSQTESPFHRYCYQRPPCA